ncbi:MAG: winged helix-turn-helix domain-containing protein, partial [Candidatus Promineifilaceae bacterium]|nr:winged helix-turn-helix domain-containing protein [Candidatus Promineifilaceae bacterium]
MDPRLSLRFLGTFHVTLDDRPLTHFRSANVQGLLVYLALQASRPVPRDVLAALFWPDDRERAARTNLRQSLYQLRKVLQEGDRERPFLLASRETIQFDPHSRYALDV